MPTIPPDQPSDYYQAVIAADADLEDALSHVRARQDAGEITVLEAANERIRLLENHIKRVRWLRDDFFGGEGGTS